MGVHSISLCSGLRFRYLGFSAQGRKDKSLRQIDMLGGGLPEGEPGWVSVKHELEQFPTLCSFCFLTTSCNQSTSS